MLIDTHCHLDAPVFDRDRAQVISRAQLAGVKGIVIPAVHPDNFMAVRDLARSVPGGAYALGIHPLYVPQVQDEALRVLEDAITAALPDPKFVGIGEIGLDFFVPELNTPTMRARQTHFYTTQLALAQRYQLPVILHVRRSQDMLLKHLRQIPPLGGIAHAFNGSLQQAEQFINLGLVLGFGGAMTFSRALQIRRLAQTVPNSAWVLETDAPDIPPAWLERQDRNEPAELARIAQVMATLRSMDVAEVLAWNRQNALKALPRLAQALHAS